MSVCEKDPMTAAFAMFVGCSSMNHLYQHFRVAFPIDYCLKHFLIAFAVCPGHIVAQSESAPLKGSVQFVGVVVDIFIEIHDAAVELTHILNYGAGHKTAFD